MCALGRERVKSLISGPHPHPPPYIQRDTAMKTKKSPKIINLMQLLVVNPITINHTINSVDSNKVVFGIPTQN